MALGTSGLPDSGGRFWWFAGPLSRATPHRADACTRPVAQKPKAEVLEPQSWGTRALRLRAPWGLPEQRWRLTGGPPHGPESLGAGACLWPTQLLGRWPATLMPEALLPPVLERPDQACSRIHPAHPHSGACRGALRSSMGTCQPLHPHLPAGGHEGPFPQAPRALPSGGACFQVPQGGPERWQGWLLNARKRVLKRPTLNWEPQAEGRAGTMPGLLMVLG